MEEKEIGADPNRSSEKGYDGLQIDSGDGDQSR